MWESCTGYVEVFLIIKQSQASWDGAGPELGNKVWMENFPNFLGVKICFRGCENRAKFIAYAIGSIWADLEGFWILFQGCTGYMGKVAQAIWERLHRLYGKGCTGYMEGCTGYLGLCENIANSASWAGLGLSLAIKANLSPSSNWTCQLGLIVPNSTQSYPIVSNSNQK